MFPHPGCRSAVDFPCPRLFKPDGENRMVLTVSRRRFMTKAAKLLTRYFPFREMPLRSSDNAALCGHKPPAGNSKNHHYFLEQALNSRGQGKSTAERQPGCGNTVPDNMRWV